MPAPISSGSTEPDYQHQNSSQSSANEKKNTGSKQQTEAFRSQLSNGEIDNTALKIEMQ